MSIKIAFVHRRSGFSLVELMIAMVLGLFLIGGVVSVFLANRQVYRQNENLARMQENARYAFEILARDIREAGGIVCRADLEPTNTLASPSTNWWSSWNDGTNNTNGIRGFEGRQSNEDFPQALCTEAEAVTDANHCRALRVEGADDDATPDALIIQSASGNPFLITAHNPAPADGHKFTLNTEDHGFSANQVVMACDYSQAALFKISGVDDEHIEHSSTVLQTPPAFQSGGQLTLLSANAWYISFNGRIAPNGAIGRSLYRLPVTGPAEEIAEGVTDMQISYLEASARNAMGFWVLPNEYKPADEVMDWRNVVAVRIKFTLASLEAVGTDGGVLSRTWDTVVTLRNRHI